MTLYLHRYTKIAERVTFTSTHYAREEHCCEHGLSTDCRLEEDFVLVKRETHDFSFLTV